MNSLISAVRDSLRHNNWYAALFISLALPDICGNMNYPSQTSKERYTKWFGKYLSKKYIHEIGPERKRHVFLSGEDCYALRCSILHEGSDVIARQGCKQFLDQFIFTTRLGVHCNYIQKGSRSILQLNVQEFCEETLISVEDWLGDVVQNSDIQKRLQDTIKIYNIVGF